LDASPDLRFASSDGIMFVAGEIDIATADQLRRVLEGMAGPIVLDLNEVEFLDSAGIAVLVEAYLPRQERGEVFRIVAASLPVRRVLEISGLLERFTDSH